MRKGRRQLCQAPACSYNQTNRSVLLSFFFKRPHAPLLLPFFPFESTQPYQPYVAKGHDYLHSHPPQLHPDVQALSLPLPYGAEAEAEGGDHSTTALSKPPEAIKPDELLLRSLTAPPWALIVCSSVQEDTSYTNTDPSPSLLL